MTPPRSRPFVAVLRLCFALLLCPAALCATVAPSLAGDAAAPPLLQRLGARLDQWLAPRCLTPEVGRILEERVAAGALDPLLASEFRLSKGDIQPQHIDLEIVDRDGRPYAIRLAQRGAFGNGAESAGELFEFHLLPTASPPSPAAQQALLAMASLFDAAIPASALERCSGANTPRSERRFPRRVALLSAGLQVAILVFAIFFALRALGAATPRGEE